MRRESYFNGGMESLDYDMIHEDRRPRTASVLLLLSLAALVFSYLWAYCLSDALVAADILAPISRENDPRPRWLVTSWLSLTALFIVFGWICRFATSRQMKALEQMEMDA